MPAFPKPKNYCRCGCGTEIKANKKWVSGHNLKRRPKDAIVKNGRLYKKVKCTECGNKFEKRSDGIGVVNLCSIECRSSYQSRTRKGKPQFNKRNGKFVNCANCNKKIYRSKSRLKKSDRHFCNYECRSEWNIANGYIPENFIKSPNNKGKRNGRYKHGKRVGSHVNKKKVREQVIERDGGNWCLLCGKPGPGLHLHRVVYGSQGGKYEVDNCVQLCAIDHERVHSSKKKWMPILLEYLKTKKLRIHKEVNP